MKNVKAVEDIFYSIEFEYPENEAGGTGYVWHDIDEERKVLHITLIPYGCSYNQPYMVGINEEDVKKLLHPLGYTLKVEERD